jgi:hypothetical protein
MVKNCVTSYTETATGNYNIKAIEPTQKLKANLNITKAMEDGIRGFIPNHVLAPLDAGRNIAELRKVTVLFIVFAGLKITDDKASLGKKMLCSFLFLPSPFLILLICYSIYVQAKYRASTQSFRIL